MGGERKRYLRHTSTLVWGQEVKVKISFVGTVLWFIQMLHWDMGDLGSIPAPLLTAHSLLTTKLSGVSNGLNSL